jgi:hypothetical protein
LIRYLFCPSTTYVLRSKLEVGFYDAGFLM